MDDKAPDAGKTKEKNTDLPAAEETPDPVQADETEPAAADDPAVDAAEESHQKSHAKAKENLSLVWTFISTFIVACIVIIAAALVAVKISGCYLFTVQTGSMTPTYPVNTVVLVKPYGSFEEVQVGDVVTYLINEEGATVTHRVVSIDTANETVTTQGDANSAADASPVLYGNVVGKVIIGIPKIGKAVNVITDEDNRVVIIVIIVVILVWAFAWDWVRKLIRKRRAKKKSLP